MANYDTLKTSVSDVIKTNGKKEITGALLQQTLMAMINSLGSGYQFIGVATPETNPGTPDAKVFCIANGKGAYTNFGGIEVTEDDVVVLYWDTLWHKVSTGIARDEDLTNLEKEVATKQNTLTAGENITIEGNVISSTGGGGGGIYPSDMNSDFNDDFAN